MGDGLWDKQAEEEALRVTGQCVGPFPAAPGPLGKREGEQVPEHSSAVG